MQIKKILKNSKLLLVSVLAIVAGVFTSVKYTETKSILSEINNIDMVNADFVDPGSGSGSGGSGDSGSGGG
jgi:hypothetical protein